MMTKFEIIKKLIGSVTPIGETNADNERFENLKEMCELANMLIAEIDDVAYRYRNAKEYSVKRASDFASKFLTNTIGISDK